MSNIELPALPEDILYNIKTLNLPVVNDNVLSENDKKSIKKDIKLLVDICNYKSIDKETLLKQNNALFKLFKNYILITESSTDRKNVKTFTETNNDNILISNFFNMYVTNYISNQNLQKIFCHLMTILLKKLSKEESKSPLFNILNSSLCDDINNTVFIVNKKKNKYYDNMITFILKCYNEKLLPESFFDNILLFIVFNNRKIICQNLYKDISYWLKL